MRTAAQTAFIMAILTLVSKFIGFFRELLMAYFFGTTYVVDAYVGASNIPNMLFAGILGAIATSFTPLYSKKVEQEGEESANLFTSQTINILFIVATVSSLVGIIFSDQLVAIFTRGFTGETAELASFYVKVTFSYTFFTAGAGILQAYLKYKNVFISPIIVGYFQNIALIGFIIIASLYGNRYLVVGALLGAIINAVLTWVISYKKGYKHKFNFHASNTVKDIFKLSVPVFIGSTISQINLVIDRALASGLQEGSIAALNYANLIVGLITGISSTIIATIIYPKLAKAHSQNDDLRFNYLATSGISLVSMLGIPFSMGAIMYSNIIIQIIYERGAFGGASTELTSIAFTYYAVCILFSSLSPILVQIFYSKHDTKTPMIIAAICIGINITLNLLLVGKMAHGGLALATTVSSGVQCLILMLTMRKKYPGILNKQIVFKLLQITASSTAAVGISYLFYYFVGNNIWMPRMVLMFITVLIAGIIYLAILRLFKLEELTHLRSLFKIGSDS